MASMEPANIPITPLVRFLQLQVSRGQALGAAAVHLAVLGESELMKMTTTPQRGVVVMMIRRETTADQQHCDRKAGNLPAPFSSDILTTTNWVDAVMGQDGRLCTE